MSIVLTVDGIAGKGTPAERLAAHFGFALMDWIASKTEDKHHKPHGPVAP